MATLTTQTITRAGVVITPVAAAGGGDAMEVGSGMMLQVVNGAGAPINVTLNIPAARTYEPNVAITSPVIAVTNGTTKWIGPIDAATFADTTTGLLSITYSSATTITVAAVKLSQP